MATEWEDLPPVFPVLERLASPTRPLFLGKRNRRSPGTNARYKATANATKKAKVDELNQLIRRANDGEFEVSVHEQRGRIKARGLKTGAATNETGNV